MSSAGISAAIAPMSSPLPSNFFKLSNPLPVFLNFNNPIKKAAQNSNALRVSNCLNLRAQELRNPLSSPISRSGVVSLRLQRLTSEFRSLKEPIDRVKRLLDYASLLTQLTDSVRSPENRVPGCAAQVWLEVEIDELGRIRFGADSDSEITKGFCYCLIYMLDGAYPDEVLMVQNIQFSSSSAYNDLVLDLYQAVAVDVVSIGLKVKGEDLADMNVGLPVRSRVNSWHNVLVGMQDRTRSLMMKNERIDFSSLVISPEDAIAKDPNFCGSCGRNDLSNSRLQAT